MTTDKYKRPQDDVDSITRPVKLYLLEAGGVDNWHGYDDAISDYIDNNEIADDEFDDTDKLYALEEQGVDNWDWYGESLNHYSDWVDHVMTVEDYMGYEEFGEMLDNMYKHHQNIINKTHSMLRDLGYIGDVIPHSLMGYDDIGYIFDSAWLYIEKLEPPIEQYFSKDDPTLAKQYIKMALSSYFHAPQSDENSEMIIEGLRYKILLNRQQNKPIEYTTLYRYVHLVCMFDNVNSLGVYHKLLENPKFFSGLGDKVGSDFVNKAKTMATKYIKENDLPFTINNFMPKAQEHYIELLITENDLLTRTIKEIIDTCKFT